MVDTVPEKEIFSGKTNEWLTRKARIICRVPLMAMRYFLSTICSYGVCGLKRTMAYRLLVEKLI
jgi:hypothetical protein